MKETIKEKKYIIGHQMDYGVYIVNGEDLYDAKTASDLKKEGTWQSEGSHLVVFAPGLCFQLDGYRGKSVPFQKGAPSLKRFRVFDVYEALHMTDEEAKALSDELVKDGCESAIEAASCGTGCFLPSLGHLTAIHHYSEVINSLIAKFTQDEALEIFDWYWSCNRYSASYAWNINMSNGGIYSNGYVKTLTYRVRAISAIDLTSLTLHLSNSSAEDSTTSEI